MPAAALTQAVPYFEAWNAHDAGAVTAALADGGTYADPTTEGPLAGAALAEHARALFGAFPDLNFEVLGAQSADAGADGTMVVQWLMRGTNTGPWSGQPPTGRPVAVRGVDVFTVTAGEITSAEGTSTGRRWPSSSASRCARCRQRPARSSSAMPCGPRRAAARSPVRSA
jgi:steroid delta-isomerase-like uncharacterized protein